MKTNLDNLREKIGFYDGVSLIDKTCEAILKDVEDMKKHLPFDLSIRRACEYTLEQVQELLKVGK